MGAATNQLNKLEKQQGIEKTENETWEICNETLQALAPEKLGIEVIAIYRLQIVGKKS